MTTAFSAHNPFSHPSYSPTLIFPSCHPSTGESSFVILRYPLPFFELHPSVPCVTTAGFSPFSTFPNQSHAEILGCKDPHSDVSIDSLFLSIGNYQELALNLQPLERIVIVSSFQLQSSVVLGNVKIRDDVQTYGTT